MAIRNDFTAGEVLAAADLNDTFGSKVNYPSGGADGNALIKSGTSAAWGSAGGQTLISTTSLTGSSVLVSGIPQTYKNLRLVIRGFYSTTDDGGLTIRVNNDSTANRHLSTNFGNVRNIQFNATSWINSTAGQDNGTTQGFILVDILDYTNTSTWKAALQYQWNVAFDNTAQLNTASLMHSYNQTTAISSLSFAPNSGTFSGGSVLLYGIS
jgi:hypothetical protein